MTRKQTDSRSHREITDLLPWYVNETLSPAEREEVAAHLAGCPDCVAETGLLQSVSSAVEDSNERLPSPSDGQLDALLSRIEEAEAAGPLRKLVVRLNLWWGPLPASAKWTLAAQAVAVIALVCASALLLRRANLSGEMALRERQRAETLQEQARASVPESGPTREGREPGYEALSGPRAETAGPFVTITVDFREGATVKEVRELLTAVGANIVSGPSSVGSYDIRIPVPPDSDGREVSRAALERLRSRQDLVELAEPLP